MLESQVLCLTKKPTIAYSREREVVEWQRYITIEKLIKRAESKIVCKS